jgi:hypothetical protein
MDAKNTITVPKTTGRFSVCELSNLFSKANYHTYDDYLGQGRTSFAEIIGRSDEISKTESYISQVDLEGEALIKMIRELKASQAVSIWEIYWIFKTHLEKSASLLKVADEKHVVNFFLVENSKNKRLDLLSITWEPEDHYCDRNSSAGAGDIWFTDPAQWKGYVYQGLNARRSSGDIFASGSIFGDSWSRKGRLFLRHS